MVEWPRGRIHAIDGMSCVHGPTPRIKRHLDPLNENDTRNNESLLGVCAFYSPESTTITPCAGGKPAAVR